jgi:hypothetical protein
VSKNYEFRWIEWNIEKVEKHGRDPHEVEAVVNNPVSGPLGPAQDWRGSENRARQH